MPPNCVLKRRSGIRFKLNSCINCFTLTFQSILFQNQNPLPYWTSFTGSSFPKLTLNNNAVSVVWLFAYHIFKRKFWVHWTWKNFHFQDSKTFMEITKSFSTEVSFGYLCSLFLIYWHKTIRSLKCIQQRKSLISHCYCEGRIFTHSSLSHKHKSLPMQLHAPQRKLGYTVVT